MKVTVGITLALVCLMAAGASAAPPVTDGMVAQFVADEGLVKADGNPCQNGEGARRWWAVNAPGTLQVAHSSLADNGALRVGALNGHNTYEFIPMTTFWGQDEGGNLLPANDPPNYTIFAVVQNWLSGSICRITGYNDASYHSREAVEINRGYQSPDLPFHLRHRDDNYRAVEPDKGFHIDDANTWELAVAPHIVEAVTVTEPTGTPGIYRGVLESSDLRLDGVPAAGTREYYINPLTELPREPRVFHVSTRNLQLGYGSDEYGWLAGELAEFIIYSRALTAAERDQVGQYLSEKYNIPYTPTQPTATNIDEAKAAGDNAKVNMTGQIVCAIFQDASGPAAFAIEKADRSAGIRVVSGTPVAVGDGLDITGTTATVSGERVIQANTVTVVSNGNSTPGPVGMSNRTSGGGERGGQPAVIDDAGTGRASVGLNNVGLLMTVYGQVKAVNDTGNYDGYFYVDDGSGLQDGSGNVGVRCRPSGSGITPDALPAQDSFVTATGVLGVIQVAGQNVRYLWTTGWK